MGAAPGHPPLWLMPQLRFARGRRASAALCATCPFQRPDAGYRKAGQDMPVALALDVAAGPVTD